MGDIKDNLSYARAALLDSLKRGEAPLASHLLYTQVLDDSVKEERVLGMEAGFAWQGKADLVAVYADLGISEGMGEGIRQASLKGIPIKVRYLEGSKWKRK